MKLTSVFLNHGMKVPSLGIRPFGRDHRRFRRQDAGGLQDVDHHVDHDRRGDEVEHDGGDDDVAAALGLQPAGDEGPEAADRRRREDRRPGSVSHQGRDCIGERDEDDAEAGDIGLAVAADVEEAGMGGDRHREAGEDEVGRVVERVAEVVAVAEGAGDDGLKRGERVLADGEDDDARDDEGQRPG